MRQTQCGQVEDKRSSIYADKRKKRSGQQVDRQIKGQSREIDKSKARVRQETVRSQTTGFKEQKSGCQEAAKRLPRGFQ